MYPFQLCANLVQLCENSTQLKNGTYIKNINNYFGTRYQQFTLDIKYAFI